MSHRGPPAPRVRSTPCARCESVSLCAAALALWLPGGCAWPRRRVGRPATGSLSFADPAPLGIGYEWTVLMHRRETMEMVHAVGAKSWQEPSNPDGAKGWTHTSNWVALELVEPATVKIVVDASRAW